MPIFAFKVRDEEGRAIHGTLEADELKAVRNNLADKGYYVISVREKRKNLLKGLSAGFTVKVGLRYLSSMARQLAALFRAGVPISNGLRTLEEQSENKQLKDIIFKVREDVQEGLSLSIAFEKRGDVFPPVFINLVRAGEISGHLDEELDRLAVYLERNYELRRKVKDAFIYPSIVGIVSVAVVIFLLTYLVPIFSRVYSSMGVQLPLPTLILIKANQILSRFWWILGGGVAAVVLLARKIGKSGSRGSVVFDYFKLHIPVFGKLIHKVAVTQFIRTFGAMLSSGVNTIESMRAASHVTGSSLMERFAEQSIKEISEGQTIAMSFRSSGIFPPMVSQMISAGESSGNLEEILNKTSEFLESDVDDMVRRLTAMVEPLLTILMGFVVGFIAIAIYLPMFDIVKVLKH